MFLDVVKLTIVSQDTSLECHRGHFYVQDQVGEGAFFGMDVMRLGCAAHGVYIIYVQREREREIYNVFSYMTYMCMIYIYDIYSYSHE